MRRVGRLVILVRDYAEAIAFYRDRLGFEVFVDIDAGERRFVHVRLPSQTDFGIWLLKAESSADLERAGGQTGGQPVAVIYTDRLARDVEELSGRGVTFTVPIKKEPGAMFAHFVDLYGNEFVLVELSSAKEKVRV